MFIISVAPDLAVGVVFTAREKAEATAVRMGLSNYQIVQTFSVGEKVVFRESETGPEELGTISEVIDSTFYMVALEDGTTVEAHYPELTPTAA